MLIVVAVYLYALSVSLLLLMLWQYLKGKAELMSVRNFIVLGFITFQLSGAAGAVILGGDGVFTLQTPVYTSLVYAAMATTFVAVFFFSYRRATISQWLARMTPTTRAMPGEAALWMIALVLLPLSWFLRFGVGPGLLHNITAVTGTSFSAAACGLAGWLWARRFLNPGVIIGVAFIGITAAAIITTGEFGRRGLVALGAAMLWGIYYSKLRYLAPKAALFRFALVALIPLLVIALFTSSRDAGQHHRTAAEHLDAIRHNADLGVGLMLLFRGQDAGTNSLWLIEQFPGDQFETRPLFTLYYLAVYMYPRDWWAGKPDPLSDLLPHMAAVPSANRDRLKLGPGIIGHSAAEGGIPALLIYAALAGLFIRYLDEIVMDNLWSPLMVISMGIAFGHVIGMPRGETSAFTALFLIAVVTTYLSMLVIGKAIESITGSAATYQGPDPNQEWDDEEVSEDYDQWPEYGEAATR